MTTTGENWQNTDMMDFHTTTGGVVKNLAAKLIAGRKVDEASVAGAQSPGVILSTITDADKPVGVIGVGFKKVVSGAAFSDLDPLAVDTAGKYRTATAGQWVVAYAMEAATAADQEKLAFLLPMGQFRFSEATTSSIVDLTDSTGLSGTHDDTLAATTLPTTLTDSTGLSGTHDDTLAATTVPTITATNPAAPTAYSAVVNMTDPVTKAEGEAVSAALATLRGEVATYETAISALVVDVGAILALEAVVVQNQSDTAQKVIEQNTLIGVMAQNISDVAQKVKEIIAALDAAGVTL